MKSKKILILSCILSLMFLPIMFGCAKQAVAPPSAAQTEPVTPIKLKFNSTFPPNIPFTDGDVTWINEIEKQTGGRVEITPYFLSGLAPSDQQMIATITGLIDICELDSSVSTGELPMCQVFKKGPPDTKDVNFARIQDTLVQEFPMFPDYSQVKYLYSWFMGIGQVFTINKPIHTPDDAIGVKMGVVGGADAKNMTALGFSAVVIPPADVYSAVERGTVDGLVFVSNGVTAWNIAGFLKYHSYISSGSCPFTPVMNKQVWNNLPPDIQQVFDKVDKWAIDYFDPIFTKFNQDCEAQQTGIEQIHLTPEEMAKFVAKYQQGGVPAAYVAEMSAKGLPAQKLLDRYLELLAKAGAE